MSSTNPPESRRKESRDPPRTRHLLCLGFGYTARALVRHLDPADWELSGTRRSLAEDHASAGPVRLHRLSNGTPGVETLRQLEATTHLLVSVPPGEKGDTVLPALESSLLAAPRLRWIAYLSSTGVYGDHRGARVDETSTCRPTSDRANRRLAAERQWRSLYSRHRLPVHVFRLAGIYGPGRSVLDRIRAGDRRRIDKPGHVFNRIHVDDIALTLAASIDRPMPGRTYNVSDNEPCGHAELVGYACRLLGLEPGPQIPFTEAAAGMSAAARSFWADSRRVDNTRLKTELEIELRYPSYRDGLRAILSADKPSLDGLG